MLEQLGSLNSARGTAFPAIGDKKLTIDEYIETLILAVKLENLGTQGINKKKIVDAILADQISLLPYMTQLKGSAESSSLTTTCKALAAILQYEMWLTS